MKTRLLSSLLVAGACAMFGACSDDSPATPAVSTPSNVCSYLTLLRSGWLLEINTHYWIIGDDNVVVDIVDNPVGTFDGAGNIVGADGSVLMTGVDLNTLQHCDANFVPNAESSSSAATSNPESSSAVVPGSSAENPTSSSVVDPTVSSSSVAGPNPGQSSAVAPASSSDAVPASSEAESSSSGPELGPDGFPTLESYGPPPAEYTKNILNNGNNGWNSRYWDACKPHCAWISNGQEGKTDTTTEESYQKGMTTARNCNIHDVEVPTFTVGSGANVYWFGYEGTNNACGNAKEKGVFTCTDMAPIAVNDSLSYAYVAGPGSQTTCGKCFHLQYNGSFKDASANNAAKETHKALKGKHIIVMTSNIGHDVEKGQFDLMVPGGGVGAFDALSTQVSGQNVEWGAGFGGFLTACQGKHGYDNTLEVYQQCVKDMCDAAFGNAGFPNLLRGCHWFADWFMAADNPTYNWEEVECPQYLIDHYMTRINTHKDNNYKWRDDWSTYKQGDVLDTAKCWKDGENPHDPNGKGAGCEK